MSNTENENATHGGGVGRQRWKLITCDHCGETILREDKFAEHLEDEHGIVRGEQDE